MVVLPGAPRAREEVGVADPAVAHRVLQRGGDVLLADQLGEPLRAGTCGTATGRPRADCSERELSETRGPDRGEGSPKFWASPRAL